MLSAGTGSFDEFSAFHDSFDQDDGGDADVDALILEASEASASDAALARDIVTGEVLGRDIRLDPVNSFARGLGGNDDDGAR